MIGQTISHYRILAELGAGGMGVVYRAEDTRLGRSVALKFLPPELTRDEAANARFIHEARTASALDHPNICTIYEVDRTELGHLFIAMACYQGTTLKERIADGPLPLAEIVDVALQVARGLAKAHELGIVHRDIKPANLLITADGLVKILDFGVAKLSGFSQLTQTGSTLGTLAYMSPEQVRGDQVDARADLWSLGVVLHECLTGQLPFPGASAAAVVQAIQQAQPRSVDQVRGEVPPWLANVVARALAKKLDVRYATAADLIADLEDQGRGEPGTGVMMPGSSVSSGSQPSIAVLPFVNMSPDPENEYFGDGLAEELINALAQVKGLQVAARTSTFRFRARDVDIREIGRQLDVAHVLEGGVRRSGQQLRITAQLIDVTSGYHLWSERYDRQLADIFTVQDEISRAIVQQLQARLLPGEQVPLVKQHTTNLEAYERFLKGRYHWHQLTPEGFARSIALFEEVIALDPDFAPAYAWLAIHHQSRAFWGEAEPAEAFQKSREMARKALALDDTLPEVHASLAGITWCFDRDYALAHRQMLRALELGPSVALTRINFAMFLYLGLKRRDEALAEAARAEKLDPFSGVVQAWANSLRAPSGQHARAIQQLQEAIERDPNFWQLHLFLCQAFLYAGDLEAAIAAARQASQLSGGAAVAETFLICALTLAKAEPEATERFTGLKERSVKSYVSPTLLAWIHGGRGELAAARDQLARAVAGRDSWLICYRIFPPPMQADDPAIVALLEKNGI